MLRKKKDMNEVLYEQKDSKTTWRVFEGKQQQQLGL